MQVYRKIEGGITTPKGFEAAGVACGLKQSDKKDMAIIFSRSEAVCSGVFTKNVMAAAPVNLSKEHIKSGKSRGIVVNSGYANACTGNRGMQDAEAMAQLTADGLAVLKEEVVVASTGVIGNYLPMDKIKKGINLACQKISPSGGADAAEAIMTTDTCLKQIAVELKIGDELVCIGGMAKGAGMIKPNMATMLGFITTDADIEQSLMDKWLKEAVDNSFNMITVDGETSTNDMVVMMANGSSGLTISSDSEESACAFKEALGFVCYSLAKMIVMDGEGATKFITVNVCGAKNKNEAKDIAMAIANSLLVKTAFYGQDANLGRILAAAGHSGVIFNPYEVELYFQNIKVIAQGSYIDFNQDEVNEILKQKEIEIKLVIGKGNAEVAVWTTDLSHDYVEINSEYRT